MSTNDTSEWGWDTDTSEIPEDQQHQQVIHVVPSSTQSGFSANSPHRRSPRSRSSSHGQHSGGKTGISRNNSFNNGYFHSPHGYSTYGNPPALHIHSSPSFQELEMAIGATLANNQSPYVESPYVDANGNYYNAYNTYTKPSNYKMSPQRHPSIHRDRSGSGSASRSMSRSNSGVFLPPAYGYSPHNRNYTGSSMYSYTNGGLNPNISPNAMYYVNPFLAMFSGETLARAPNTKESASALEPFLLSSDAENSAPRALVVLHPPSVNKQLMQVACVKFGKLSYLLQDFGALGVTLLAYNDVRHSIAACAGLQYELGRLMDAAGVARLTLTVHYSVGVYNMLSSRNNMAPAAISRSFSDPSASNGGTNTGASGSGAMSGSRAAQNITMLNESRLCIRNIPADQSLASVQCICQSYGQLRSCEIDESKDEKEIGAEKGNAGSGKTTNNFIVEYFVASDGIYAQSALSKDASQIWQSGTASIAKDGEGDSSKKFPSPTIAFEERPMEYVQQVLALHTLLQQWVPTLAFAPPPPPPPPEGSNIADPESVPSTDKVASTGEKTDPPALKSPAEETTAETVTTSESADNEGTKASSNENEASHGLPESALPPPIINPGVAQPANLVAAAAFLSPKYTQQEMIYQQQQLLQQSQSQQGTQKQQVSGQSKVSTHESQSVVTDNAGDVGAIVQNMTNSSDHSHPAVQNNSMKESYPQQMGMPQSAYYQFTPNGGMIPVASTGAGVYSGQHAQQMAFVGHPRGQVPGQPQIPGHGPGLMGQNAPGPGANPSGKLYHHAPNQPIPTHHLHNYSPQAQEAYFHQMHMQQMNYRGNHSQGQGHYNPLYQSPQHHRGNTPGRHGHSGGRMSNSPPNNRLYQSPGGDSHEQGTDHSNAENVINIEDVLSGKDTRLTVMIRNIPNKYTQQMLLDEVNQSHQGTYDFFYLPIDFKNKCNVGYAFVSFLEAVSIVSFVKAFRGKKWKYFNSEKICAVTYARIQGKSAMISRFQNSSILEKNDMYRPLLFYSTGPNVGQPEPFPLGSRYANQQQQQSQHQQGQGHPQYGHGHKHNHG